jgi:site-specific DNA-cytosine methylase
LTNPHTFNAFFPFCGLGAGARGFINAMARLGPDSASFRNLGGIDIDPDSCRDFELLAGVEAMCADLSTLTPAQLLAWLEVRHGREVARRRPDCVFTSPPCKGFSRLLGNKKALEAKYQALNQLVFKGLFLVCETWSEPPPLIVLENVPGIMSRGEEILAKARQLLSGYGYAFHTATHDCGEIGGLAQHRRRFLLVARHQKQCGAYVYQPPKKRVRACGEVLSDLPIPGGAAGGDLHQLPKLSWLNWVRLALIPAGGDWRDLPKAVTVHAENANAHRNKHAVVSWEEPAPTVIGATRPGSGAPSVADPRPFDGGRMGVQDWAAPAKTVTGESYPSNGSASVADPRLAEAVARRGNDSFKGSPGLFGVIDWAKPSPAVTGSAKVSGSNGKAAVADPRALSFSKEPFKHVCRVTPFDQPVGAITASPSPSSGAGCVADPRIPPELLSPVEEGAQRRTEFPKYDVRPWTEPARTVAGSGTNGGFAVADPRLALGNKGPAFSDIYKVSSWEKPISAVTGATRPGGGAPVVADPRLAVNHREGRHTRQLKVRDWKEPAGCVTGDTDVQEGAQIVADPRVQEYFEPEMPGRSAEVGAASAETGKNNLGLAHAPYRGALGVQSWDKPAKTVRGQAHVRTGPAAIADPRPVTLEEIPTCACRSGSYGVMSWEQAAATITGSASVDNGRVAVADPRKPPDFVPVIIAADGTWHRPLTTLELAALQGLPSEIEGKPLQLAGRKIAAWRERIGNAVPVQAATAIAETLLKALLASALGTWFLSPFGEPIWVRQDGLREDQLEAELGEAAAS